MLRGPRRIEGALRVELPQAAAAHPGGPPRGLGDRGLEAPRGGHLRRGVPPHPPAARGDLGDRSGGAAHRRGRPGRARDRGVAARDPLGVPGVHPRAGHGAAKQIPMVFLTSNNTRELSEALKRRCLYLYVGYPDVERERDIILTRVPGISSALAEQIAQVVRSLRALDSEEGAVRLRDPRLGPHARRARARGDRRARRSRDAAHPAEVPVRHRAGHQGTPRSLEARCLTSSATSLANCAPRGYRCR